VQADLLHDFILVTLNTHISNPSRNSARAFSLVELLLTLVLVMGLLASSVMYFTGAFTRSGLDEGAEQFVTLVRYAQAEAANSGRKVRLTFELDDSLDGGGGQASPTRASVPDPAGEGAGSGWGSSLRRIVVEWEPDALQRPGTFEVIPRKVWADPAINELIGVEGMRSLLEPQSPGAGGQTDAGSGDSVVRSLGDSAFDVGSDDNGLWTEDSLAWESSGMPDDEEVMVTSNAVEVTPSLHMTFYPDGTCDPFEVVIASRRDSDARRVAVRIHGSLGRVSKEVMETGVGGAPDADLDGASPSSSVSARSEAVGNGGNWADELLGTIPGESAGSQGRWAGARSR
jgi:type II secretory pathway pseudopilin PulG